MYEKFEAHAGEFILVVRPAAIDREADGPFIGFYSSHACYHSSRIGKIDPSAFVFRLGSNAEVWHVEKEYLHNEVFLAEREMLSFGYDKERVSNCALRVDSKLLEARTSFSKTFGNPPLYGDGKSAWNIGVVELWGFQN